MDTVFRIAAQGFMVALTTALVMVPLCIIVARRSGIVDHPGGRKQHGRVMPLLGGVGVFVAMGVGLLLIEKIGMGVAGLDLKLQEIGWVLAAGLVIFLIGLVDDVFKDRMAFHLKLLGQVTGVLVLMWPSLAALVKSGGGIDKWIYQLFFLCWYLTIVNSFNFSDNMNGLMAGLSIIAFSASMVYLGREDSLRSFMIAMLLVGALLGFMPYNFPRSRVFLGDAGSMFVGFWMAWIQFDMARGFLGSASTDLGISNLIPAVLIMGVPLFDAAYVVSMRLIEKRPMYLGDNHHLSHRLVRAGFTPVEAVVILWGLAIILAGVGILASYSVPSFRYMLFGLSFLFMVFVARFIMSVERAAKDTGE